MKATKLPTKRHYKTFDPTEATIEARKLIEKTKKKKKNLHTIRIDINTVVQISTDRTNIDEIIDRVKNKRRTISIVEQIEYGNYA